MVVVELRHGKQLQTLVEEHPHGKTARAPSHMEPETALLHGKLAGRHPLMEALAQAQTVLQLVLRLLPMVVVAAMPGVRVPKHQRTPRTRPVLRARGAQTRMMLPLQAHKSQPLRLVG